MTNIDKDINKVFGSKVRSFIDLDLSAIEKDIQIIKSEQKTVIETLLKLISVLEKREATSSDILTKILDQMISSSGVSIQMLQEINEIKGIAGILSEKKSHELALMQKSEYRKSKKIETSEHYQKLVDMLEKRLSLETSIVGSRCGISSVTALRTMRYLAMSNPDKYRFISGTGNSGARIIHIKQR